MSNKRLSHSRIWSAPITKASADRDETSLALAAAKAAEAGIHIFAAAVVELEDIVELVVSAAKLLIGLAA